MLAFAFTREQTAVPSRLALSAGYSPGLSSMFFYVQSPLGFRTLALPGDLLTKFRLKTSERDATFVLTAAGAIQAGAGQP